MSGLFFITTGAILVYMTGWFLVAQLKGRNDIADVAWGLGFIVAAAVSLRRRALSPAGGAGLDAGSGLGDVLCATVTLAAAFVDGAIR